jgi:23S rRNA (uracil1939-C5)-methyltransferase
MKLEIVKAGINGEGIAFFKRKPVFIEGCFPDDVVDADLIDEGRHYKGRLKAILKKSPDRIRSVCSYADKCGACALMELKYEKQLAIKMQLLENALYKYAEYEGKIEGIVKSDDVYGYRNKCNLPIIDYNGKLVNALYKQGSNHPCLITTCFIHEESVEEIRRKILDVLNRHKLQAYDRREKKGMRQLIVRAFDKGAQAVLVTGNDTLKENVIADLKKIKGLKSLFQGINTVRDPIRMMPEKLRPLFGKEKIDVKSLDYELELSPQAFFQLNHKQAERIYQDAAALIKEKQKLIIEGYCGIGTISLAMHDKAEKIIGIEIIEKAIKDAKDNAKKNKVENVEFRCGDAAKEIRKIVEKEKADVIVVDPPRTGLDDELLKTLLKSKAKQIIYISCNPSTLGKDLYILKKEYEIHLVRGYDMFPNTPLVETVCCLYHQKKDFISVPYEPKNVE